MMRGMREINWVIFENINNIFAISIQLTIFAHIIKIDMAQTSMTLRVDNSLKKNFDNLCEEFGFTTTAAITVFMKTVVRERKIPFEIKASSKDEINAKGWEAILKMGKQAEEAGIQDMSLEEINAVIKEVRDAR